MSATAYTQKTIPLPMKNFQQSLEMYSQYRDFNIDTSKKTIDSKFTKTDDAKYSESSNFPNFPPGTTPPDDSFMKLVYLNYIANKSIVNSVEKLN
jgi:hypothetical protein